MKNPSASNPKIEVGEHTRLGCRWTRLASSRLAQDILPTVWNFSVRSGFSASARKTARAARALPIPTSEFRFRSALLHVLAAAAATLPALLGSAMTLTVRNNNDAGAGSFRQAVSDNNALGGSNTIAFSNIVTGTITLTGGELVINKDVTITGPGVSVLTISGNTNSRIFNIATNNAAVTISGLTLANGSLPFGGTGGCIQSAGNLTLSGCVLSNNGGGSVYGAAIANVGLLTVSDSIVCSNRGAFGSGGALYNNGGTATLLNSTFYGNAGYQGGALNNQVGVNLLLTNCTLYGNSAGDGGGGIFNAGTLSVRSSTIVSNSAVGAAGNGGGGGIWKYGPSSATVMNTIVARNTSTNGPDCFGTNFSSAGYNFIGKANGSAGWTGLGDQVGTISGPLDPLLGPVQNNGGPTPTFAPLPGSMVIDQGKSPGPGLGYDRRGRSRPADFASILNATGGDGSDIGAVEIWPDSPSLNIRRAGNSVVLTWPAAAMDFRLQSATNLPASNNWSVVTGTPGIVDGQFTITNAVIAGSKFYRLVFP